MVNAPVATTDLYEHAMLKYEASGRESVPSAGGLQGEGRSSMRILLDLYVNFYVLLLGHRQRTCDLTRVVLYEARNV